MSKDALYIETPPVPPNPEDGPARIDRSVALLSALTILLITISFGMFFFLENRFILTLALGAIVASIGISTILILHSDSQKIETIASRAKERESLCKMFATVIFGALLTGIFNMAALSISDAQIELASREMAPNISIDKVGEQDGASYSVSCEFGVASHIELCIVDRYHLNEQGIPSEISIRHSSHLIDGQGTISRQSGPSVFQLDTFLPPEDDAYATARRTILAKRPMVDLVSPSRHIEISFFDYQNNHVTYEFAIVDTTAKLTSTSPHQYPTNNQNVFAQHGWSYEDAISFLMSNLSESG